MSWSDDGPSETNHVLETSVSRIPVTNEPLTAEQKRGLRFEIPAAIREQPVAVTELQGGKVIRQYRDAEDFLPVLPTDAAARNEIPMADGLLYYFPAALAEIAKLSKIANDQHNPGEPMHWARDKSKDHANKILKHLVDAGLMDPDGTRHSTKLAWRALALLQVELEQQAGAPRPRNAY